MSRVVHHAARSLGAMALASGVGACGGQTSLPPHGEALFVVDTDLPAPAVVSRLRLDLYADDGTWFESRDVGRSDPSDWPASFSVYSDDDAHEKVVLARLRVYPEGAVRDYRGERFTAATTYSAPRAATSLDGLCADAPVLPNGGRVASRLGPAPLTFSTQTGALDCDEPLRGGSVAARVVVTQRTTFRFDVADAIPFETPLSLMLRASCTDAATQIACRAEPDAAPLAPGHLPRFDAVLDPGTYFLIASSRVPNWPADVTLESLPLDQPSLAPDAPNGPDAGASTGSGAPRLRSAGGDAGDPTPTEEPIPTATVDRLVAVRLVPGTRGRVRVILRAACVGRMARLGEDPTRPDLTTARTCLGGDALDAPIVESPLEADLTRPTDSQRGTAVTRAACSIEAATGVDAVCVPGGLFVLGGRLASRGAAEAQAFPERVARLRPFFVDRHEVTVGRYRAWGHTPNAFDLAINDGSYGAPLTSGDPASPRAFCTYSTLPRGHEDLPLTCVSWTEARAFCLAAGGDLPTEAQWEYAATAAGRQAKTVYPWGDDDPTCSRAVLDRDPTTGGCRGTGTGPALVAAQDGPAGDVNALGVVDLEGNVSEWTRDAAAAYDGPCWAAAGLDDPTCDDPTAPYRVLRGGSWRGRAVAGTTRAFVPGELASAGTHTASTADLPPNAGAGFRCVYPGSAP